MWIKTLAREGISKEMELRKEAALVLWLPTRLPAVPLPACSPTFPSGPSRLGFPVQTTTTLEILTMCDGKIVRLLVEYGIESQEHPSSKRLVRLEG